MKNKIYIHFIWSVILFSACKNKDIENLFDADNDIKKHSIILNDFDKIKFKDRAEELIYIREYLKYKLPLIIIEKDPQYVKKAQYELITNGENPELIDAAKRTRRYDWDYERFMYLISSGNIPFKEVKRQLETKGEINSISPIRGIRVPPDRQ